MDKLLLDDDVLALVLELKAMASKLRAKGLDDDTLKDIVLTGDGKGVTLSVGGVMNLLDYGATVRLNPVERALYTFFLKHEDGLRADDLWEYYDELVQIYRGMTRFEDPDAITDAIDAVLDDSRVTLYANLSRIKKKITLAAGRAAADKYAILRGKDDAYRIAVRRDLVRGAF
jgi:hypothetical protein